MNPNLNNNPCVCCGEYAVEGEQLCWRCQQGLSVKKTTKDDFIEKFFTKALDKKNKV